MLNITVYGPGCAKCKEVERRVHQAVKNAGVEANIQKATDFTEMAKAGILTTPAISINGAIKAAGRVPTEDEIMAWLQ